MKKKTIYMLFAIISFICAIGIFLVGWLTHTQWFLLITLGLYITGMVFIISFIERNKA